MLPKYLLCSSWNVTVNETEQQHELKFQVLLHITYNVKGMFKIDENNFERINVKH